MANKTKTKQNKIKTVKRKKAKFDPWHSFNHLKHVISYFCRLGLLTGF